MWTPPTHSAAFRFRPRHLFLASLLAAICFLVVLRAQEASLLAEGSAIGSLSPGRVGTASIQKGQDAANRMGLAGLKNLMAGAVGMGNGDSATDVGPDEADAGKNNEQDNVWKTHSLQAEPKKGSAKMKSTMVNDDSQDQDTEALRLEQERMKNEIAAEVGRGKQKEQETTGLVPDEGGSAGVPAASQAPSDTNVAELSRMENPGLRSSDVAQVVEVVTVDENGNLVETLNRSPSPPQQAAEIKEEGTEPVRVVDVVMVSAEDGQVIESGKADGEAEKEWAPIDKYLNKDPKKPCGLWGC